MPPKRIKDLAPSRYREGMPVREFVKSDIPEVLSLYWNHMAPRKGVAPPQLEASFKALYFFGPLVDGRSPSFVYQDSSGEIVGFMGIIARKMSASGQPIRVAFAGNFVVHRKARSGLAAARLVDAYIGGNHDLLLTDSANDASRHISERRGFQLIHPLNIHWSRPLRPVCYATYAMSRALTPGVSATFRFATKPFCVIADRFLGSSSRIKSRLSGTELSAETLLYCLNEFRKGYCLWPEYNLELLRWLLSFMEQRTKRGNLRSVAVRDEAGKTVGWYIYYVKPGAVAEVVQVGGEPRLLRDILRHLWRDAWEQGAIALHGLAEAQRIADFSDEDCFFTCRGGWALAYSRRPELIDILQRGHGFLSRLDGEWCLHPGE